MSKPARRFRDRRIRTPIAPYSVAIVDMQENYTAAEDQKTIAGVLEVLRRAIADRAGIHMVLWVGKGRLRPEIRRLLRGYPFVSKVYKSDKDGSAELVAGCKQHGYSRRHIVVCGIQTMICVAATVEGLCQRLPLATIEVVTSACGDLDSPNWKRFPHPYVWSRTPQSPPPRPRNLVLNNRFVGPIGPMRPTSKARQAHPDLNMVSSNLALAGAMPAQKRAVLFRGACLYEAPPGTFNLLSDKKNME